MVTSPLNLGRLSFGRRVLAGRVELECENEEFIGVETSSVTFLGCNTVSNFSLYSMIFTLVVSDSSTSLSTSDSSHNERTLRFNSSFV